MVFFFTTVAMKFEAISAHLMIAFLTRANAIRKFYTLMMTTIDVHLRSLITENNIIRLSNMVVRSFGFLR